MSDGAGISRRTLLGGLAGSAAVGLAGGVAVGRADDDVPATPEPAGGNVGFYGEHQAGIGTAAQDRLHFAALDLLPSVSRGDLVDLLRDWTAAAAAMTTGDEIGGPAANQNEAAAPRDTGEALGLDPAKLTITVGFGPSLFERGGEDRFGIAERRPRALAPLPHFADDNLDPARSGGEIAIQACSDDPQVAVHAVRNLVRLAHGAAAVRYSQLGFGRTSATTSAQVTPRNLLGFKDGTNNIRSDDGALMRDHVWVAPRDESGPRAWIAGGSYMVARRIRMHIETWDRDPLGDQETVIGRQKLSGAPFGEADEFAEIDFAAKNDAGELKTDPRSHVALAHPSHNSDTHILRRGYSFVDGSDELGRLEAGLFFISYQRSPEQFVRVQRALAGKAGDLLNEYIVHVGSGLWAVPPGVRDSRDWWGSGLFA
ncbi:MAG: iron uptake transporter deferrochelatase/peroxidase subunit [Baekduia sp.]